MRSVYQTILDSEEKPLRAICQGCWEVASSMNWRNRSSQAWRPAVEKLQALSGWSGGHGVFAAEIIRDLLESPLLSSCSDLDSWAPIDGPTRRCLGRLYRRAPGDKPLHGEEQLQRELLDVYAQRHKKWPGTIEQEPGADLRLLDVRAQLGEFERYLKARAGKPERGVFHPRNRI